MTSPVVSDVPPDLLDGAAATFGAQFILAASSLDICGTAARAIVEPPWPIGAVQTTFHAGPTQAMKMRAPPDLGVTSPTTTSPWRNSWLMVNFDVLLRYVRAALASDDVTAELASRVEMGPEETPAEAAVAAASAAAVAVDSTVGVVTGMGVTFFLV